MTKAPSNWPSLFSLSSPILYEDPFKEQTPTDLFFSTEFQDAYLKATPLHYACYRGAIDIVRYLLANYPQMIWQKGPRDWTALHLACDKNHTDIVRLLLQKKADHHVRAHSRGEEPFATAPLAQDNTTYRYYVSGTPLDIAKSEGHQETIDLMTQYGIRQ